jgi:hypothetical protein
MENAEQSGPGNPGRFDFHKVAKTRNWISERTYDKNLA